METEAKSDTDNGSTITVNIKFNGRSIPVEISSESTVKDLKSLLQPLTNVLSRGQKLIFKGKVLVDEMTLESSKVRNGAKIMLMASQGGTSVSCEAIARVREEVDKLSPRVVAIEEALQRGTTVEDREFVILTELFMVQLLKLDSIEAEEGEARTQRKKEVSSPSTHKC
ncbi:LRR repeats and ubiquitin-like domain-containing protein At2g30105 isoform X2 [Lycium ferocissimum]|uniref:LRR repeats and ubiquitin-like domain-containing protein At2g30105 isoform X2 n=1 Tax=Lycium ferocissimum TaxID=112874 RepID=UPI0028154D58|nr:LRR repeats and ubiquitin-like domain-containing protein At2g30105 isoform X2 [Lycium ferocissimum]